MFVNNSKVMFAGKSRNGSYRIVPVITLGVKVGIGYPIVAVFDGFLIAPENIDAFCIAFAGIGITGRKIECIEVIKFCKIIVILIK